MRSSSSIAVASFLFLCWSCKTCYCQLQLDDTYCEKLHFGSDLELECKDAKTLAYGINNTYSWKVTEQAAESQAYDMILTVVSSSGDAAMCVVKPVQLAASWNIGSSNGP